MLSENMSGMIMTSRFCFQLRLLTFSEVHIRLFREKGHTWAAGVETPTLTPPSDFLFNRLLAAVKTKRKIKSPALYPLLNLKSGSWIHKRLICLTQGQESPETPK